MIGRRNFLGLLGVAGTQGKAIAEGLADGVMQDAGIGAGPWPLEEVGSELNTLGSSKGIWEQWQKAAALLNGKLPDWMLESIKDRNRRVYSLEVDIASLRSVSASAKVSMQRRRNIALDIREAWERPADRRADESEKFKKKYDLGRGWYW